MTYPRRGAPAALLLVAGLLLVTAAGFPIGSAACAEDGHDGEEAELVYVKKETRDETRRATLARYFPELECGPWHLAGPFDNPNRAGHEVVYPPEQGVDLAARYRGREGREVAWRDIGGSGWDKVGLRQFGSEKLDTEGVAYLYREITSPAAATAEFHMGSDDCLKFWLDGRLLVDANVYRGLSVEDHRVRLRLAKGKNRILVKVTQGVGEWEFQMRPVVDDRILALLEFRLNQDFPLSAEDRFYRMFTLLEPREVVLEVGGLDVMPDGRPIVTTRRGEVWIVELAYEERPLAARYKLFAAGLHEPLGARFVNGGLLVVQRPELTRLVDTDGDDVADRYETVSDRWGVSGNYHEFAFGPKFDGQGRVWATLNVGFCGGLGKSVVPWRGWAVTIDPATGELTPVCGGLRSPNGLGANAEGEMFYTDNQGDWVGTNKLSHLARGDWHGHPSSNHWYDDAGIPEPDLERSFKPPAVWFPYRRMGQSASDIALDDTGGKFGPFSGQIFVGDQTLASVMRVFLEKVKDSWQGACFPFRSGFDCGVNRLAFGKDGSLFAGMTDRGWGSVGQRRWGLQRLAWSGVLPFEVLEMRARKDGFELTFTRPVEPTSAGMAASYQMANFTYERWEKYGSPEIDRKDSRIREARVSPDGRTVRLVVEGLRPRYVHELMLPGVRSADGEPLLHAEAYYTLNVIPTED